MLNSSIALSQNGEVKSRLGTFLFTIRWHGTGISSLNYTQRSYRLRVRQKLHSFILLLQLTVRPNGSSWVGNFNDSYQGFHSKENVSYLNWNSLV